MRLPAEWECQQAIEIAWPHAESDWAPYLDTARQCFAAIGEAIAMRGEKLIIVTADENNTRSFVERYPEQARRNVELLPLPTNDTWTRDSGLITTLPSADDAETHPTTAMLMNDFRFNGWGGKFEAALDNAINAHLQPRFFPSDRLIDRKDIVLEGGSIESDGRGTILTTTSCLFAPHRNDFASKTEAEKMLRRTLGARRILWLDHGYLAGDDTDGHIDTLARLCPDDTITYVRCDDTTDEHFAELQAMEQELRAFRTADGRPYRLLPLPMAPVIRESDFTDAVAEEGDQRLPSTYANYLVMNGAVLMPTYGDTDLDAQAAAVLAEAFPGREIVGIDCRVLVRQHGSLHCSTMQFPCPDSPAHSS